jgi:hypothetical protein
MTYMLEPDKLEQFMAANGGSSTVTALAEFLNADKSLVRRWAHYSDVGREGKTYVFDLKAALALQDMLREKETAPLEPTPEVEPALAEEPETEPALDGRAALWDEAFRTLNDLKRRFRARNKRWDKLTSLLTQLRTP